MIRLRNISLLHKAVLAVLFVLIPIAVTFIIGYHRSKTSIQENAVNDLSADASVLEGMIYQFFDRLMVRVADFSSDGVIRDHLDEIVKGRAGAGKRLGEYIAKNKLVLNKSISSIAVLTLDGRVAASTDAALLGKDFSGAEFFTAGLKKPHISEGREAVGLPFIAASSAIKSRVDGKVTGVLVNFVNIDILGGMLEHVRVGRHETEYGVIPWKPSAKGKQWNVYVVNRDKRLIIKPPSVSDNAVNRHVDVTAVRQCLDSSKEFAGFYENFLGESVAGASLCMPGIKWTVLVEVPREDMLSPVSAIRRDAVAAGAVVAGIMALLLLYFMRRVARPLKTLAVAAGEIAGGNYGVSVSAAGTDEIGVLSRSFNKMAAEINRKTGQLEETNERLSAVLDNSTAVIYMKDVGGRYMLVNRTYENLFHLKSGDITGKTDAELFPPDIAERFIANDRLVLSGKEPRVFDEDAPQDGVIHNYISVKVPIMGHSGAPIALCGISTDITERKRAEEKIARLNRLYLVLSRINEAIVRIRDAKALYEEACRIAVKDGGFLMAWVGVIDRANMVVKPAASCGSGTEYLDVIRISVKDDPEGRGPTGAASRTGAYAVSNDIATDPKMSRWRSEALRHGYRSSAAFPILSGGGVIATLNLYSGESCFFNDEEIRLLDSLAADISFAVNSMELEKEAIRANEELLLIQSMTIAIREADDFNSALIATLKKVCEVTGWLYGKVFFPSQDGFVLEYGLAWYSEAINAGEFDKASRTTRFGPGQGLPGRVWKTRKTQWVDNLSIKGPEVVLAAQALTAGFKSCVGIPVLSGAEGADVLAVLVFFSDKPIEADRRHVEFVSVIAGQLGTVLLRKRSDEARFELQKRHEELLNSISIGVFRTTVEEGGSFVEANPALVKMIEAESKEELFSRKGLDFYQDKARRDELIAKLLKDGYLKNEAVNMVTFKRKKIIAQMSAVLKRGADGTLYLDGIVEDITERRRIHDQLVQSQRMEAVGQLAGGIAHDFNNILTAIIGYSNLLLIKPSGDDKAKRHAEQILFLAEKAANLTKGLLAFSRKQEVTLQPINLNDAVRMFGKILARLIGTEIDVKIQLAEEPLNVMADAVQIEQVLMNLAANARDAMPQGGVLSIATGREVIDNEFIRRRGYGEKGAFAAIAFSDTGVGMDEETQKRIFEPFFTTKEVGKGTGLGLPLCYGIIKQHNGFIDFHSAVGRGTSFVVYLPLMENAAVLPGSPSVSAGQPRAREIILLAEDEKEVRAVTAAILRESGYNVIEAVDGEDAVNKFQERAGAVDALVLDMIMPKKSGKKAYDEISAVKPGVKAIFVSGYDRVKMKEMGILEDGLNMVLKPVAQEELLRRVREVLDK